MNPTDTIPCLECGKQLRVIHANHLRSNQCTGLSKDEYRSRYPNSPLSSKDHLKTRSHASKQLHQGPYRQQAAKHLQSLNADPAQKERIRQETTSRWTNGTLRRAVKQWHRDNREISLASIAFARTHIKKKQSKLHLKFKKNMVESGLVGFITEYEIGYYCIDEARPDQKIAVEIDGCWWHGCNECGHPGVGEILACDARKTTYLKNRGWTILRMKEHEIKSNPATCIQRIREALT